MQGKPVKINGDGADSLDFTYVADLVHGILRILENERSKGEIFNITYGESRTIRDLANIVSKHFPEIQIQYLPKDKLTPDRGTLCVDKAKKLIGYQPLYPLEKGFVKYIEWYKSIWKTINNKDYLETPLTL